MVDILFISDYVCPHCVVAKAALKAALKETGIEANITWQPYELTWEPAERVDTYHDEKRKAGYQICIEPSKQLGLDAKFPPKVIPRPYSRLAFEGWYFASDHGKGEEYNDAIYYAYFTDEKDIGEVDVLTEIAVSVGLDGDSFRDALINGTYYEKQKKAREYAKNVLQPTGVPTMYVNGKKVAINTYTKEEMIEILKGNNAEAKGNGIYCSPEGCYIGDLLGMDEE